MTKILGLGVDVKFPIELQQQRQKWLSSLFPDTAVVVRTIQHGPAYLESLFDQALAGRAILEEVIRAENEGFDAVGLQ
jgi:Asp/Glu/hydantoin racemase